MISLTGVLIFASERLGIMFFFNRKKSDITENEEGHEYDNLLCRFVTDGTGRKIGESVSVDDDILIIKSGSKFLGVPLKHIEEKGKTILVKGLVDYDKAYEMGEEWRKESFREINKDDES